VAIIVDGSTSTFPVTASRSITTLPVTALAERSESIITIFLPAIRESLASFRRAPTIFVIAERMLDVTLISLAAFIPTLTSPVLTTRASTVLFVILMSPVVVVIIT